MRVTPDKPADCSRHYIVSLNSDKRISIEIIDRLKNPSQVLLFIPRSLRHGMKSVRVERNDVMTDKVSIDSNNGLVFGYRFALID